MTATEPCELVVPDDRWRAAVRAAVADPTGWAAGRVVREPGCSPVGLLAADFQATNPPRSGHDFPPLSVWAAVAAPLGDPPDSPEGWLPRLRPLFGQTLALVLVGFGPRRDSWRGWVIARDRAEPLAGVRVVGPGMTRIGQELPASDDDPARWTRLRGAVGERAFARLRTAEVAVVGASRTGTAVATHLAALGVRALTLIDGDRIEPHNLDGLVHATPNEVGVNKAIALGRRLVAYRPDLLVRAVPRPLDAACPDPAPGHLDLIATCVDADAPRLRAAYWARRHLTPHLDVGTGVTAAEGDRLLAADVRMLLPGRGCVRCVGGLADLSQAEYEWFAPPGALPRRPPETWDAGGRLGSLVTLNGLAAAAGVQCFLDLLAGRLVGSLWQRLRWVPGTGMEATAARVDAGRNCPVCGENPAT